MRRGRLIVVSGPSGAGKSTLIRQALSELPDLAYSVSATTRKPRKGEVHGRDYVFLEREEFDIIALPGPGNRSHGNPTSEQVQAMEVTHDEESEK